MILICCDHFIHIGICMVSCIVNFKRYAQKQCDCMCNLSIGNIRWTVPACRSVTVSRSESPNSIYGNYKSDSRTARCHSDSKAESRISSSRVRVSVPVRYSQGPNLTLTIGYSGPWLYRTTGHAELRNMEYRCGMRKISGILLKKIKT